MAVRNFDRLTAEGRNEMTSFMYYVTTFVTRLLLCSFFMVTPLCYFFYCGVCVHVRVLYVHDESRTSTNQTTDTVQLAFVTASQSSHKEILFA
jgi:hypothetical protein